MGYFLRRGHLSRETKTCHEMLKNRDQKGPTPVKYCSMMNGDAFPKHRTRIGRFGREGVRRNVMAHPQLSIVIPAYNESARIEHALACKHQAPRYVEVYEKLTRGAQPRISVTTGN